jgi:predicted RNase H-like HicB family nuclease
LFIFALVVFHGFFQNSIMNLNQVDEYQVKVFRYTEQSADELWRGYVLSLPYLTAEGNSREQVLQEIKRKLSEIAVSSEIVTLPVSSIAEEITNGVDESKLAAQLRDKGYRHFGIFANDPDALDVFDEIENERNQLTIGDE